MQRNFEGARRFKTLDGLGREAQGGHLVSEAGIGLADDLFVPKRMDEGDPRGAEGARGGGVFLQNGSVGHGLLPDRVQRTTHQGQAAPRADGYPPGQGSTVLITGL